MLKLKHVLRYVLGILFIVAGLYHFIHPLFYLRMMPSYLPAHLFLIYLSGFLETALGILLLIRQFTRLAAWGLIALVVMIFPANIHMAMNPQLFPDIAPLALWLRLPFQAVFIAWAYGYTGNSKKFS